MAFVSKHCKWATAATIKCTNNTSQLCQPLSALCKSVGWPLPPFPLSRHVLFASRLNLPTNQLLPLQACKAGCAPQTLEPAASNRHSFPDAVYSRHRNTSIRPVAGRQSLTHQPDDTRRIWRRKKKKKKKKGCSSRRATRACKASLTEGT